ncbi:MAG: hypothetical protein JXR48_07780 [Candidatus Delongbacteria bacterium]|nr:hypothetical protein [Candidatus Delongbacteria bacterium]
MYNRKFIESLLLKPLPEKLNFDNLFNISLDCNSKAVKLYFLSENYNSLYKYSLNGNIEIQYDASKHETNFKEVEHILGYKPDFNDLVLDTFDDKSYYIFFEGSSFESIVRILEKFRVLADIDFESFFQCVETINNMHVKSFSQIFDYGLISMIKLPRDGKNFKIYSRPFLSHKNYILDQYSLEFLKKVYDGCNMRFDDLINNLWVSYNFKSDSVVISTQNDNLKINF